VPDNRPVPVRDGGRIVAEGQVFSWSGTAVRCLPACGGGVIGAVCTAVVVALRREWHDPHGGEFGWRPG
jgi:formylmethanofuran dehydrogenase subunit C